MPTLAALLILAAVGSLRVSAISTIWRTGLSSQIAIVATFVATLLLPVAAAVGLGVALSLLLQLNQAALDLKVVQLVPQDDGRLAERDAPGRAASHDVVVLDVYGSLRYAGARTLQERLPDPRALRHLRSSCGCGAVRPSARRSSPSSPPTPSSSTALVDGCTSRGSTRS
jgi:SulP family sulfate permease